MDLLLKAGAKVNLGTEWSGTSIHVACNSGTTRMVELLLTAAADSDVHANTYATPLSLVCRNIDPGIAIRTVEFCWNTGRILTYVMITAALPYIGCAERG